MDSRFLLGTVFGNLSPRAVCNIRKYYYFYASSSQPRVPHHQPVKRARGKGFSTVLSDVGMAMDDLGIVVWGTFQ